jgi:hypothetical protein
MVISHWSVVIGQWGVGIWILRLGVGGFWVGMVGLGPHLASDPYDAVRILMMLSGQALILHPDELPPRPDRLPLPQGAPTMRQGAVV